jgi:hypothetical protein
MLRIVMLVSALALVGGCARAHANKRTLHTSDCGVNWTEILPGNAVPYTSAATPCSYTVSIPDSPMQGEARFKTSFKDRVLAQVDIAYEYQVFDGVRFISEAKYLGKASSDANDASNSNSAYESAENTIIEKRIREVATEMLLEEDIVEFVQAEFEDRLLEKSNELLADKGVKLNFMSFVPVPEEQTRLAIDMITAHRIYESHGLGPLGHDIAVSRAGATKIVVEAPAEK